MNIFHLPRSASKLVGLLVAGLLSLSIAGCSDGDDNVFGFILLSGCADTQTCVSNPPLEIDAERPAQVMIPSNYNTNTRYPLIIVLHGFGVNGYIQTLYLGLDIRVDTKQYVLVLPDGTVNDSGLRYWDATAACCAGPDPKDQVDDVGYIRGLIEQAAATYSIDTSRVGLFGHSNGGYMALRMACEASDLVSSVVSLAGSTFADAASCAPATNPVSVLTLHGTEDDTVLYDGRPGSPGALETIARFAGLASCNTNSPLMPENIDVDASIDGDETQILRYINCQRGTDVELWTLVGSPHAPAPYNPAAMDSVVDWMTEHQRF